MTREPLWQQMSMDFFFGDGAFKNETHEVVVDFGDGTSVIPLSNNAMKGTVKKKIGSTKKALEETSGTVKKRFRRREDAGNNMRPGNENQ